MVDKSNLKERLTNIQYRVTQLSDTERPFTGEYWNFFESGQYNCVVCGQQLFESTQKFKSECGWPAFSDANKNTIKIIQDNSYNMVREEARCSKCDAHLGHRFDDGPKPTGTRYCINSASIQFTKK